MLAGRPLPGGFPGCRRANVGFRAAGPEALDSRADPGSRNTVKSTNRASAQGKPGRSGPRDPGGDGGSEMTLATTAVLGTPGLGDSGPIFRP